MTYTKIIAATASLTSLIALAAAPALAETTSLKPLQAASLNDRLRARRRLLHE